MTANVYYIMKEHSCDRYCNMNFLFQTANLKARYFVIEDLAMLNQLHCDQILMQTTSGSSQTILETKKELEEIIAHQEKHNATQLAFFDNTGNFVGRCGIIYRSFENDDDLNYEIRYAIHRRFQGLGYGSEAVKGYLDYIFKNNNKINQIIAAVRLDGHEASSKILQKLQFKYIGNKIFQANKKPCKIWMIERH